MPDTEQLIAHAYSAYDTDARAHGPDGYAAFHDAVARHVVQFLEEAGPMGATMDAGALEAWCQTLTLRLEDAERRADRFEQAWLLERTRNEVWQLQEDKRQLEYELAETRRLCAPPKQRKRHS